jgi:hypothetical protein
VLVFDRKWFSEVEVRIRLNKRLYYMIKDRKEEIENSDQSIS